MKQRLADIAQHKSRLLQKIELQRSELAGIALHWKRPMALADMGMQAVRMVFRHRALFAGLVTAVLALRRRGAFAPGQEEKPMFRPLRFDPKQPNRHAIPRKPIP